MLAHVLGGDSPLGASAAHVSEVDAEFARELAHRRRGVRLRSGRRTEVDRLGPGAHLGREGRRLRQLRGDLGRRRRRCGRDRCNCNSTRRATQHHDRTTLRDLVADLHPQRLHHAGGRRWDFHRGFVALHGDQRLLLRHGVADLDQQLDDFDILEVADVGHDDFHRARGSRSGHGRGRRCSRRLRRCCGLGGGRRRSGRWSRRRCRPGGVEQEDEAALRDLVAELDAHLLHDTGRRRRDLHRGLVAFHRDQRLLLRHGIAWLDQDLDDLDVLEVADVRYLNFHELAHVVGPFFAVVPRSSERGIVAEGARSARCCGGWRSLG